MTLLASVYARGAGWRRSWYARHPHARRPLARPVISVGNLAVGGSGKTPVVATLARWLLAEGHRPSILSRGYGRDPRVEGVVVVSNSSRVLEPVRRSGDEPQMLARALPGVPVLAGADRFVAGRIAERTLGCTIHLLDDGFQHFQLRRDIDLLLVDPGDLDADVLPSGRLREPLAAARAADALLVSGSDVDAAAIAARLGVAHAFRVIPAFGAPRRLEPFGEPLPGAAARRAIALAGIARPERFFDALRATGWDVLQACAFRDHHWFSERDVASVRAAARQVGADAILTTEKDAMRLTTLPPASIGGSFAYVPMTLRIEPAETFTAWLRARLAHAVAGAGAV